ncbi:MAG: hypothetical protein ABFR02_10170 [Campylobacterota bacterium]
MFKFLSFLSLGTLLSAHEGHTNHLHALGNLHALDVIGAAATLLISYVIYKKSAANR